EIYGLLRSWNESQVSWNNAASGTRWGTAGASGSGDRSSTAVAQFTPSATGNLTITLNAAGLALLQSWINSPSSNHGLIIQDYGNSDGYAAYSSEDSTSRRPKLTITFAPAAATFAAARVERGGADGSSLSQPTNTSSTTVLASAESPLPEVLLVNTAEKSADVTTTSKKSELPAQQTTAKSVSKKSTRTLDALFSNLDSLQALWD